MRSSSVTTRPRRATRRASSLDLRPGLETLPAETRRLVRAVGTVLAAASLVLACAAAAQTAAYGPRTESGGLLAWVFAFFVGAAALAVFLVILTLVRSPSPQPGERLPGGERRREA
jgi:hypothetical protein